MLVEDFKMKEIDVCSVLSFKSCTAAVKYCVGFSAGSLAVWKEVLVYLPLVVCG